MHDDTEKFKKKVTFSDQLEEDTVGDLFDFDLEEEEASPSDDSVSDPTYFTGMELMTPAQIIKFAKNKRGNIPEIEPDIDSFDSEPERESLRMKNKVIKRLNEMERNGEDFPDVTESTTFEDLHKILFPTSKPQKNIYIQKNQMQSLNAIKNISTIPEYA